MIDLNLQDDDENDEKLFRRHARRLLLNTSKGSLEKLVEWRKLILPDVKSIYRTVVALASIVEVDFVSEQELVDRIGGDNEDETRALESLNRLEQMLVVDSGYTEYKGTPHTKVIWLTIEYNDLESLSKLAGRILPFIS